jgi:membrane-associated HD superfamily phosphohydrolase
MQIFKMIYITLGIKNQGVDMLLLRGISIFLGITIFVTLYMTSLTMIGEAVETTTFIFLYFVLPLILSLAIVIILMRIGEDRGIVYAPVLFIMLSFMFSVQGEFAHSILTGMASFTWFLNGIRPYRSI